MRRCGAKEETHDDPTCDEEQGPDTWAGAIAGRHLGPAVGRRSCATIDACWRAANYLSVGQIYLFDNPLLRKPLTREHIKPRLLGHWGTTPGLNFIYAHLNRVIRRDDLDMIYVTGPGHGGPALVAQRISRRHVQRGLPERRARTRTG